MKALFSYNPVTDFDLPCTEAGLTFRKGDILVVLNRDDPHWWQAKQINNTIVGLIPSSRMRERCVIMCIIIMNFLCFSDQSITAVSCNVVPTEEGKLKKLNTHL